MSEETTLMNKPKKLWNDALKMVKGEDSAQLMEQFTAEMTLVAEGLSEDQSRLDREMQSLQRRFDRLKSETESEQDRQIQRLESELTAMETALRQEHDQTAGSLSEHMDRLEKRLDAVEKKMNSKQKATGRAEGIIKQLTILAAVAGGSWIIVTLLQHL